MTPSDHTSTAAAGASPAAIAFHYDLGNAFCALRLDRELTCSCAMFADGDDLERAQRRKIDHHARESGAVGARHVLDVGCGWGSTLRRLVAEHGVGRATGLTLSAEQARHVERFRFEPARGRRSRPVPGDHPALGCLSRPRIYKQA
jgi:cyclopropane-fatty-acyl-phospholipid synthase